MSELLDIVTRLLKEQCPPRVVSESVDGWSPNVWQHLVDNGYTLVGVPEDVGGSGGSVGDAATLVRLAGYFAAPVPFGETLFLAAPALAAARIQIPPGALTIGEVSGDPHTPTILVPRVPYARFATNIVVVVPADEHLQVALLSGDQCQSTAGSNLAGEPYDNLVIDRAVPEWIPTSLPADWLLFRGSLCRSLMLVGALERVLEFTVRHAWDREQFGRPLAKLQAVQQLLAIAAGQVAATRVSVDAGVAAVDHQSARFEAAVAKITAGRAVEAVSAAAHQIHGAIGFTDEHDLRLWTKRLWSWRDDYGSESYWAARLGSDLLSSEGRDLWESITNPDCFSLERASSSADRK
jgi:acyl-CoA dehydrogenase